DSYMAGFDAKYAFQNGHGFWRPVTAIRLADTDGNPDTGPDPNWTPLIVTPNHPSYVALHACQSEAAAQVLASFFGSDQISFNVTWPDPLNKDAPDVLRTFDKFTAAAHEAGMSRIYGGIHWSFDVALGWQLGRKVGQYVADHFFQRLTGPDGEPLVAATVAPAPVKETLRARLVAPLLTEALGRWQAAGVDSAALL